MSPPGGVSAKTRAPQGASLTPGSGRPRGPFTADTSCPARRNSIPGSTGVPVSRRGKSPSCHYPTRSRSKSPSTGPSVCPGTRVSLGTRVEVRDDDQRTLFQGAS